MNAASIDRPHTELSRLLWYDMRPNCNAKVCTTRGMNGYSFHIAFCHSISPTTWSVSCCRPAVLLLAVILLLYDRIAEYLVHSFVHYMVTYNKYEVLCNLMYSVPSPTSCLYVSSFGRPPEHKL